MNIEIDQSGKLEATNRKTVIAFSNNKKHFISILPKDKQILQKFFRDAGKPEMFIYRVFAILCFLLIKDHLLEIDGLTIDQEYLGKSSIIKDLILNLIRKENPNFNKSKIVFDHITKKSNAHWVAYETFTSKSTTGKVIKYKEVLKYLI